MPEEARSAGAVARADRKTGTHSSSAREKHRAFVFQSTSPDHYSNLLTTQVRTTYEYKTEANHPLVSNEWSYLPGKKSVTHHQGSYNWNTPYQQNQASFGFRWPDTCRGEESIARADRWIRKYVPHTRT